MLQINEILNDTYQLIRPIGKGGFGTVFLAYHLRLEKYVVVKCVASNYRGNLSARTEVDILKNLHHPNLPQVYDIVQDHDSIYTVMDFVEGYPLDIHLAPGEAYTEQQLVRWFRQITEVLVYLHGQQIPVLHTDIKPGNILINQNGDAVLIDFNVSIGSGSENLVGYSLPFASPEQIEIAKATVCGYPTVMELDARTDIYSLGATFYQLISGTFPAVGQESIPLAQMGLGFEEAFLRVVDRCMRFDPEQRYPSARKLLSGLDHARRQNRQYRNYLIAQLVTLMLGAVLVAAGLYCWISGAKQIKQENFTQSLNAVYADFSAGRGEIAEAGCLELLNGETYRTNLRENPEEQSRLLCILGDLAFEREEYQTAIFRFRDALTYSQEPAQRHKCLRGLTEAYAESGDLALAEDTLTLARQEGLDSNSLLYLDIVLAARQGRAEDCFASANQLLQRCTDNDLCARACIAAGKTSTDHRTEVQWLEKALTYSRQRTVLRGLTVAYVELARVSGVPAEAAAALNYAGELVKQTYALKSDWLNYAAALQLNGRITEAVRALESLSADYPGDYLVLMNLAFAYDSAGEESRTRTACRQAIEAWEADRSPGKLPAESDSIQDLMSLREKYR